MDPATLVHPKSSLVNMDGVPITAFAISEIYDLKLKMIFLTANYYKEVAYLIPPCSMGLKFSISVILYLAASSAWLYASIGTFKLLSSLSTRHT